MFLFCSQAGGDAKTHKFCFAMADQGRWNDYLNTERRVVGATIQFGPVFRGEVFHTWSAELSATARRCLLNGEALGHYPRMEQAKARR